jgi:hypothetical protein
MLTTSGSYDGAKAIHKQPMGPLISLASITSARENAESFVHAGHSLQTRAYRDLDSILVAFFGPGIDLLARPPPPLSAEEKATLETRNWRHATGR